MNIFHYSVWKGDRLSVFPMVKPVRMFFLNRQFYDEITIKVENGMIIKQISKLSEMLTRLCQADEGHELDIKI